MLGCFAVAATALAAGCSGETPKPQQVERLAGGIVEVDGRYLCFECVDQGSRTVLLEAVFGSSTRNWQDVQLQLRKSTCTCRYDRRRLGGSPEIPRVHDAGDEIDDL